MEIKLDEESPAYRLIEGYRQKLDRIYLLTERSLSGSSPRSKERALAAGILEILGETFTHRTVSDSAKDPN